MKTRPLPQSLYKYRAFNALFLDMIVTDRAYFADPSSFNDPLDSRPTLTVDLSITEMEKVLRTLIQVRNTSEMRAAAKTIGYRGRRTLDHIETSSRMNAQRELDEIEYNATDPYYEDEPETVRLFLLGYKMEEELLRRYDKGILSLAERRDCPLMWSHYGDQHRGLCVSYSIPSQEVGSLHQVHYGGGRLVKASQVARMLEGSPDARKEVDDAVLLRKAYDWKYEKEWRLIGTRGLHDSTLELESILFGMRCDRAVKFAVVKALEDRNKPVTFHEVVEVKGKFQLKVREVDFGELCSQLPRQATSAQREFANVAVFPPISD